jgi:hypothetical protein
MSDLKVYSLHVLAAIVRAGIVRPTEPRQGASGPQSVLLTAQAALALDELLESIAIAERDESIAIAERDELDGP